LTRTSPHKQLPCSTLRVSHWAWTEPGEWLSTTKLQSKRSNPNARRQLGVRKEATPLPPNHGGDEFLTEVRQVTSSGQDWASVLRGLSGDKEPLHGNSYTGVQCYNQTKVEPQPVSKSYIHTQHPAIDMPQTSQDYTNPITPPDPLQTTITPREGTMPTRVVTRAGGSHTTKSTQRAYACRQQGPALASIICSSNNSSASTNSQWHASIRQEVFGSQWYAHNQHKPCTQAHACVSRHAQRML